MPSYPAPADVLRPSRRWRGSRLRPLAAVAAAVVLTSCSAATTPARQAGSTHTAPGTSATTPATPPASSTGSSPSSDAPLRVLSVKDVATDLATPWGLARLPDGSHLVSLRDEAKIVRIAADGTRTAVPATGPGGTVPGVRPEGEGGLLGLAIQPGHPDEVYAYFTSDRDNRVVRMAYAQGRLGAPHAIVTGIPKAAIHNGGQLAFGPDHLLYITTGDGGEHSRAQDRRSLAGKILRVTPTGAPAHGNPFPGSRVWTLGHRNVQGIGWDDRGRMFASEFGQNTWDELNRIEPGHNYGWPMIEGMGTAEDAEEGFTAPLAVWPTDQASPSGLAVGGGSIWLAALRGERLWRVPLHSDGSIGKPQALLEGHLGRLRGVEVSTATDGGIEVLLLTSNTFRGSPRPHDDRLVQVTFDPSSGS